MNRYQQIHLKERIDYLKDRLREIEKRGPDITRWDVIDDNLRSAKTLYVQFGQALIDLCDQLTDDIKSPNKSYKTCHANLSNLFALLHIFRKQHIKLFHINFPNVLYIYLFLNDLLKTPGSPFNQLLPNIKFVIVPSGEPMLRPLCKHTMLAIKGFGIESVSLDNVDEIYEFNCDNDDSLFRLTVLGHEVFHALIHENHDLRNALELLSKENKSLVTPLIKTETKELSKDMTYPSVCEFFCDFAAAYFYGPAFGKAFVEEISFGSDQSSSTHPQRAVRVKFILGALKQHRHPYKKILERFYKDHFVESDDISEGALDNLESGFRRILAHLNIYQYKHVEMGETMIGHFQNNLPYVYRDIRYFLNNLPSTADNAKVDNNRYSEVIRESVRKSALWNKFSEGTIQSGELFPYPRAFK